MASVIYAGILKQKTGVKNEEIEGNDLASLLKNIKKKYNNEVYRLAKSSLILVNEVSAGNINGYKTKLSKEDIVKFLPVCGGG